MYYTIPLAKIKNAFHPVVFSHIIEHNQQLPDFSPFNPLHNTNEGLLQQLNLSYPLNSVPQLYQDFIMDLQGNPISLDEINKAIIKSDFDTTKKLKQTSKNSFNRSIHIKNIARHMVSFSSSQYVSTKNSDHYSFLEPVDIENMYLLLATVCRKQLNLHIQLPDNREQLSLYINPSYYLQNTSSTNDLYLENLHLNEYVSSQHTIEQNTFSYNNQKLNDIKKINIIKKFDWSIPNEMTGGNLELINWKQYILKKLNDKDKIDFEEIPSSFLNDYSAILDITQQEFSFFNAYLNFQFNQFHNQYITEQKLTKNDPQLNNQLSKEKNDNIYQFITDIADHIKTRPDLLMILWQPSFNLYVTSFHDPKIQYKKTINLFNLYSLDNEKILNNFMVDYKEHYIKHFAGDSPYTNHTYVQQKLFEVDTPSKLFKGVNFNDVIQTQDFVSNEIKYLKSQLQPFVDLIKSIYDQYVFNDVDTLLTLSKGRHFMLPPISSLALHQQEKNIYYESLIEYQIDNEYDHSCRLSLDQLQDIDSSYFTHPDNKITIQRRNLYLASLLNYNYESINNFHSLYNIDLFEKIPGIYTKKGLIDTFSPFLNSSLSHSKGQSNLSAEKLHTIFHSLLITNEEFLTDNDICKLFYKNNKKFFTLYREAHQKLLFQFTDIETIEHINYAMSSILNDSRCPSYWRTHPSIILSHPHIESIKFTPSEIETLFSVEAHGVKLIVKDCSLYQQLPQYLKEVPEYAKAFLIANQKNANYNISNNSINLIPSILFQYHDFCISLINQNTSNFSWIPKKHWENQQFLTEFFNFIDQKDINLDKLFNNKKNESGIPEHIVAFFKHFEITSHYSPFIEAYLLNQQLNDKIQDSLDKKLSHNDFVIKKKKI